MDFKSPEEALFDQDNLEILKQKSRFLILGGLGFIGKNLCETIIKLKCFEKLIIVDKKMLKLNSYIPKAKYSLYEADNIKIL